MGKIYTTTVTSRPALPRSRYRTSVSYSGGSSVAQGGSSGTGGKDGVGIASIETTGSSASGGVNVVTITLTDGTSSKFNVRNGYDGAAGKSAYEVAVDEGFDGTVAAWLESLKGEPGSRGGIGPEGKSAYEIAVKEGFEGDELEWLDSLKGAPGQPGKDGTSGPAAGFGAPKVTTVPVSSGTAPSVEVTASGPDTAKVFDFVFRIPRAASGGGSAEVLTLPEYLDTPVKDEGTLYAVTYKGKCDLYLGDIRITDNITAVLPSSVLLSGPDSVTGGKGATTLYTASLLPGNVTETGLKWSCSTADGAASIDQDGLLTAQGRGTVTIVAESVARPSVKAAKSVSVNLTMRLVMTGQGFDTSRSSAYKYLLASDEVQSLGVTLISSDYNGLSPANGCTVDAHGVANLRDVISGSPSGTMTFLLSKTADGAQAVEVATIDASSLGQSIVDAWDAVAASVTVNTTGDAVTLTGLSVSGDSTVGNTGNKAQYSVEYTPSNTTQRGVAWSVISGSAYASIDQSGLLTVKSGANGNAVTIRATSEENTSIYAEKTVTVTYVSLTIAVTGVTLNKSALSLSVGDTETLVATVAPSRATDKSVVWSSSASNVASVDQGGKVTAKSAGTAVITVATNDGGFTASCGLTVAAVTETYLRVTPVVVNLAGKQADGDIDAELEVESNQGWTATCEAGWLNLLTDTGAGNETVIIGANSSNDTGAERTTSIVFTGADGTVVTVTVTQAAAEASSAHLLTVSVSPSGASAFVTIGSGSQTRYTGPVSVEAGTQVLVIAAKTGYVSKSEMVTMDSDKTLDWTLQVVPAWTLTPQTFEAGGDGVNFEITDTENVGWRIECPDWCLLADEVYEGTGAHSTSLVARANDTGAERSGFVYLYAAGNTASVAVCRVTQDAS